MRVMMAAVLSLLVTTVGLAQTSITLPATVYDESVNLQDASGNLVIIDLGALLTSTTVTGRNGATHPSVARSPKTRITVVCATTTDSAVYDGAFQFVGVGQRAVYGILTTTPSGSTTSTRTLIAVVTNQTLPSSASSFPGLTISGTPEVRMIASDVISLVDFPVASTSSSTRTAEVVTFNGTAFVVGAQRSVP
jgi:hypothetical protein